MSNKNIYVYGILCDAWNNSKKLLLSLFYLSSGKKKAWNVDKPIEETYHNILFLHNFVEGIYVWKSLKVLVGLLITTFFDPKQKLSCKKWLISLYGIDITFILIVSRKANNNNLIYDWIFHINEIFLWNFKNRFTKAS